MNSKTNLSSNTLIEIDVILRVSNNADVIKETVKGLKEQKGVAFRLIVVSHNTSDETLELLDFATKFTIEYNTQKYNYSKALNLAIPYLTHKYTLIISSHSVIGNKDSLLFGINEMEKNQGICGITFSDERFGVLSTETITKETFDGWNGIWNTASLYRTELLQKKQFLEKMPISEDQEWSGFFLRQGFVVLHVKGCERKYNNKNYFQARKLLEWKAISFYVERKYLSINFLVKIVLEIFKNIRSMNSYGFRYHVQLLFILIKNKFRTIG